jgi:gamma-D-glutamyl-L-lysine dipeptidyl-peptidase
MLLILMLAVTSNSIVTRPVANLYSAPTEDADVVSQAIYGSNLSVVEEKDGWAKVRTPDDYSGWAREADLLRGPGYAMKGKLAEVQNLFASIYRETNITKHQPIITVPYETKLEVVSAFEDLKWIQVRLPEDRSGWIQGGDVTLDPKRLSVPELVEFAKRFVGLPYLWGGTSTFGYDCSGYTQMLYRRLGVLLPRDAGPQANWRGVEPVDKDRLQPGDLLYFGASEQKITHTGMYVGSGQFINATAHLKPMVQICELNDPRWTKLLVACRRLK